jgi:hypothetical protein
VQPERAADIDIMQEVNQFYIKMYNLDQTDIQEKIIPMLDGDLP